MVTENSMNIGRREVFAPYLFYSGKRAAIVTDLPESFSKNSNAYKEYSTRIFNAFCNSRIILIPKKCGPLLSIGSPHF